MKTQKQVFPCTNWTLKSLYNAGHKLKHFWSQIVPGHKWKHYVVTNRAAVTNWSESQIVPSHHSTPQPFGIRTWLWRYTCLLLLVSMLWHRQAIFESKGDKLSSSAEGRIRTHQGLRNQIASRLMLADEPMELSRIKLKTWTWQPVPMIS